MTNTITTHTCTRSSEKEPKALTSLRCVSQHFPTLVPETWIPSRIEFGQHRC